MVEDESIIAMDLADQLEELGYRVCDTVDNCADALAAVEKHRPDLVLLDIVIKGELDGVETGRRIGLRFRTPVVYLTSYSDPATLKRAMSTAPYGYVTKPFQLNELSGALEAGLYKARLESRLHESERWFAATLRCAADGVLAVDAAGRVQFVNPHAEAMLGKSLAEVAGKPLSEVLVLEGAPLHAPPRDPHAPLTDMCFGRWLLLPNDKRLPIDVAYAPLRDEANAATGSLIAFREVSQRLAAEAALARSDDRLRTALQRAATGVALVGLSGAFLDGNAAMLALLGVSESELRALTQADVSDPADAASERQHLHQLLRGDVPSVQLEKRYQSRTRGEVWTLASVSLLGHDDLPLCYLYQVLDRTEQKREERQRTMPTSADAQRESERAQALRGDALELDFQPGFALSDGAARYVEALVRWRHPSQGRLLPSAFLALADEPQGAGELAAYTLRAACLAATRLPVLRGRAPDVAVNVSTGQLSLDGFEGLVVAALRESGLAAARLCLELPARLLCEPDDGSVARALRLKALGVQLAIDDVGPSPIALPLLARLAPARIGIAGVMVQALREGAEQTATVGAAIALGHAVGATVVGKWVEHEGQRALLARLGCDVAQGFLLARPAPIDAVVAALAS